MANLKKRATRYQLVPTRMKPYAAFFEIKAVTLTNSTLHFNLAPIIGRTYGQRYTIAVVGDVVDIYEPPLSTSLSTTKSRT